MSALTASCSSSALSLLNYSSSSGAAIASYPSLIETVYHYEPSIALAWVGFALFLFITFPLSILTYRTGLKLCWILVATAIAEWIGYIFRYIMIQNPTVGIYIITDLLILLAPNFMALVNYKVLSKVVDILAPPATTATAPSTAPTRKWRLPVLMDNNGLIISSRLTSVFFASDIIGFFIQAAGGGVQASGSASSFNTGKNMIVAGLVFQLVFFFIFSLLTLYAYYSSLYFGGGRRQTHQAVSTSATSPSEPVVMDNSLFHRIFLCLGVTILLLFVRNVYRLIEYGADISVEAPFFVFDTLTIFICMCVYARWHFGLYLPPHVVLASSKQSPNQTTIDAKTVHVAGEVSMV